MMDKIRLMIWNEFVHEQKNEFVKKLYPRGMHMAIADYIKKQSGVEVRTATLQDPEHGLTEEVLDNTDVLMWWGHVAHGEVDDAVVERVHNRVLDGMGIMVMHSGHFSKIFKKLMGTTCGLRWREAAEKERLWVVNPAHPIAEGIGPYIEVANSEMYGEHFDIPAPDELIFVSWFEGGNVFRSGAAWYRGRGKVFYFRPGHETYPVFYNKDVLRVLANGVRWAAFQGNREAGIIGKCQQNAEPLDPIPEKDYEQGKIEHPDENVK
ncbi:MAG: ThuA domain-containing protein [Kiritimatiellia bacterium]